ncbi:hypothetical protein HanIR_Chr12g0578131 [Helianthus annuus]|nr:hypothetical protein HanIR_Chr12g0578131 [Helianthus annuus]
MSVSNNLHHYDWLKKTKQRYFPDRMGLLLATYVKVRGVNQLPVWIIIGQ